MNHFAPLSCVPGIGFSAPILQSCIFINVVGVLCDDESRLLGIKSEAVSSSNPGQKYFLKIGIELHPSPEKLDPRDCSVPNDRSDIM